LSNPYAVHAFVCLGGRTCPTQGSERIWSELRAKVAEEGLDDRIRINKSGCMSQCGHGPMVCVYPSEVWYSGVRPEDVDGILRHLRGGPVLERRLYHPEKPGSNKVPVR
jgi:(2Fe-2S) ferredoxin